MIALDPNKTFWFPIEDDKPDGAALQCRFGTCRQIEQYEDELNTARSLPKNRDAVNGYLSALGKFVVGSRDLGESWQDGIKERLSWMELWVYCFKFPHAAGMSEIDLKKLRTGIAYRWGAVCRECSSGCKMKKKEYTFFRETCTTCNGSDEHCPTCEGWGWVKASCPRDSITGDTSRILKYADFADKGHWPVSGGVLDQSNTFVNACWFIWAEESVYKPK